MGQEFAASTLARRSRKLCPLAQSLGRMVNTPTGSRAFVVRLVRVPTLLNLMVELLFLWKRGPAVSGKLRVHASAFRNWTLTAGADNASGTHRPGHSI